MEGESWDNVTNRNFKMDGTAYGVPNSKTAVMAIKSHTIYFGEHKNPDNRHIYLTFSTFDKDLVILENENPFGKYSGNPLGFEEKLKLKTNYPIADFCLEVQTLLGQSQALMGYFVDIFSNLYMLNLTKNFQFIKKITYGLQPAKPTVLFSNLFPQDVSNLHLQYPLLLHKHQDSITTLSLRGTLRTFNLADEKSWLQKQIEPKTHEFKSKVLGAISSKSKNPESNTVVVAFHNTYLPYPFSDCSSGEQFKRLADLISAFYEKWYQVTEEITDCQFDPQTSRVVCSLMSTEVQIYEIKKSASGFCYCQRIFRFMPIDISKSPTNHIEHIDANRGILIIVTCREVLIFSLKDLIAKKRFSAKKKQSNIEKLRWAVIIEKEKENMSYCLLKGYNHHNEEQSKVGKPNLHFKYGDISKN